jgi:hypothetical protein
MLRHFQTFADTKAGAREGGPDVARSARNYN